ncbi:MAG: DOMON-like domain-containing protein [Deltaproteobacteria bacterium]
MTLVPFALKPFPDERSLPPIAIVGAIGRCVETLTVRFEIRGDLSALAIPPRADAPERRNRLWEGTCLELFVGAAGSPDYREFNLSPAGHWNAYRFASYREGMREETGFATLPFDVRTEPGALRLLLDTDIGKVVPRDRDADIGVCAVVRTKGGATSHWALAHPGPRPDFHRRDGFLLKIPASS